MRASSPRRITARGHVKACPRLTRGNSPSNEGMARRKALTYGSAILSDHGGRLLARHMRSSIRAVAHVICDVGRQSFLLGFGFAASKRQLSRRPRTRSGGTLLPPESLTVRQPAHRRRTSSRLSNASMRAPINWMRCVQFKPSLEGGDKFARPSRRFPSCPALGRGLHDSAALPPANRGWLGQARP